MSAVFLLPIPTSLCAKVGILFEYSRPPPRGLFCAHQQEEPPCDHLQVHRGPLQATHIRPTYPTVKELVDRLITAYTEPGQPYNWQDYGYVILIEESDVNGTLDEVREGCRLVEEKLLVPMQGRKRSHEPVSTEEFLERVSQLASGKGKPKAASRKKPLAARKKAQLKKKARTVRGS
jgi:hypothetical protein